MLTVTFRDNEKTSFSGVNSWVCKNGMLDIVTNCQRYLFPLDTVKRISVDEGILYKIFVDGHDTGTERYASLFTCLQSVRARFPDSKIKIEGA